LIEQSARSRIESFTSFWKESLSSSPVLELDGTWPSVGVLDLITFPLRARGDLDARDLEFISGCAAYLAELSERCLGLTGANVLVRVGDEGVELQVAGGPVREGETFVVRVEQDIREFLRLVPPSFPVIGDFSRVMGFESNYFSAYAIGLVTGYSPSGDGSVPNRKAPGNEERLEFVVKELSRQSGAYYQRIYPDESLGQVAELYLNRLIFPPLFMKESMPGLGAVQGMLEFFEEFNVPAKGMLRLSHNLSLSPDELISSAGIAFFAALSDTIPPPQIIAAANAKGLDVCLLRRAMLDVREALGLRGDWIDAPEFTEEDSRRVQIEKELGLLPWLCLGEKRLSGLVSEPWLRGFLQALASIDLPQAMRIADDFIDENPRDIEMRVQRIYLDVVRGDLERAVAEAEVLSTEPESETDPEFYHIWGVSALNRGDIPTAVKQLRTAFRFVGDRPLFKAEIANNLAWALIHTGDYIKALEVLDYGIEHSLCPVTMLLNKAYALHSLGREEEAMKIHTERLMKLAPTDRRVASGLVFRQMI